MKKSTGTVIAELPAPSDREQEAITEAKTRRIARRPRVTLTTVPDGKEKGLISGPSHSDQAGWLDRALDALGTPSTDFLLMELQRLGSALNAQNAVDTQRGYNAALAVLDGQRPKNEIEAQLLMQMAATHAYAMDLLGRSKRSEFLDHLEAFGKFANRLLRTYAMQCDTLMALHRGGKHVVEVRHEHVYRPRRKPEGTPTKNQPLFRGPNGRFVPPTSPAVAEREDA